MIQRIKNTNIIRTLSTETNETEIYSLNLEKICSMKNATINVEDNKIKIYNQEEEKNFDYDGKEI